MRHPEIAGFLATLALGLGVPVARAQTQDGAEKIRRLDIMLMVTALRCRSTRDDFTADYARFTARQMPLLNAASDRLREEYAGRLGAGGARRALDRLSTSMANAYGQGHPWLDCRQLGQVARNLAQVDGGATLEAAAEQLLASGTAPRFARARK